MEAMDIGSSLENINIEQVCRACFETCEQYKLLFEDAAGTEKLSLGDVFSDVAKIEIKTNPVSLPNRICLACSRDLLSAHKFIRKSQQNNNRLLEYLKNSSSTKQPDCLSEFPIDIPVPFLQIKVEKEAISEYPEPLDEDKISPSSSNESVASDFDESPLHKDEKLNKLQCTYCNRIFKRMNCLESHKKKHEEEIKKKEATEEGSSSFLCDECGHSCATKFDLKSHRLAAHTTRKAPSDVTQTEASCSAVIDKPQNQNLDADKEKNKECVESASLPEIKQEFYPSSISPALASLMASTSLENASTTKNMFIFSEKFFTIVKQLNDTDFQKKHNGLVAECSTCKSRVQGSFQITSNFTRHLRIKHPNVFKEYESIKGSNPVQKPKPTMQEQFDELLIKFLVNNMIPLGIVEDSSLRNLLTFTHSNLRVVNRPMALGVVNKLYFEMLDKMKDTIAASKYFCTTADVWIIQRQCFFGYTCHWLDERCQRQKYALACKRFPEPPTNDKVTKIIREVHSEYGLNGENIVAIVTDNGENYLKELNIVDIYTEVEDDKNLENVLQKPLKTVTVSLNLIATDDLNSILSKKPAIYAKHKSVMQKCTELWDKVRECRTSEKILSAVGTQLKFPMASKWDTVYDSIKELFVHRRNLTILCEGLELPILTNEDFEYLEEYLQMLTPIAEALDFMQNPCVMLYGYLLPTLATVRNKFRRMATNSFFKTLNVEIVSLLETALVDRFLNYFDLTDEAHNAIVASVLCPSVKLKWISALNPSFNDEKIVEVSALVRRAIQAEYDGSHISEQREAPVDVPFFDFSINAEQSETTPSTSSANTTMDPTAQNEYFAYLANPMTSPDMLNRYPTVKKAFYRYNTPLPSLLDVERLFGLRKMIKIFHPGAFADDYFEQILLLRINNFI